MRLLLIRGFGFGVCGLASRSLVHLLVSVILTASVFRVRGAGERFEGLKLRMSVFQGFRCVEYDSFIPPPPLLLLLLGKQ